MKISNSEFLPFNQIPSFAADDSATHSACAGGNATMDCFFDLQLTVPPASLNKPR